VLMKFLRWNGWYRDGEKLVKVKSWWPWWDTHEKAIGWPTVLIDCPGGKRETSTPIWKRPKR
jgi:hypothetical protein